MKPFLHSFADYHDGSNSSLLDVLCKAAHATVKFNELGHVCGEYVFLFYTGRRPTKRDLIALLVHDYDLVERDAKQLLDQGYLD